MLPRILLREKAVMRVPPAPMRLPTWRMSCLLCGRAIEVLIFHKPLPRRCTACGGYLEAKRTLEWESC